MNSIQMRCFSLSIMLLLAVLAKGSLAAPASLEESLQKVQSTPETTQAAITAGKRTAQFCFNCHGVQGHSTHAQTPNLAGQNAAYLLEQIQKFNDGRRKDSFMEGLIKALSAEEKVNIAVYFSSQSIKSMTAGNPATLKRGKEIFNSVCIRCHGEKGLGNAKIPRIASQQTEYIIKSLTRYRNETGERRDLMMTNVAKQLTDADLNIIAAYVSSM